MNLSWGKLIRGGSDYHQINHSDHIIFFPVHSLEFEAFHFSIVPEKLKILPHFLCQMDNFDF